MERTENKESPSVVVPVIEEEESDPPVDRTVEAGNPSGEHALFVVLGVLSAIAVFLYGLGLI